MQRLCPSTFLPFFLVLKADSFLGPLGTPGKTTEALSFSCFWRRVMTSSWWLIFLIYLGFGSNTVLKLCLVLTILSFILAFYWLSMSFDSLC